MGHDHRSKRDRLVEQHLPLARMMAGKLFARIGPRVDYGDLLSAAYQGLMEAANKFSPRRGAKFATYSERIMSGRMRDWLREIDPCPRRLREFIKARERAQHRLSAALGRVPADEETARAMGLSAARYRSRLREVAPMQAASVSGRSWAEPAASCPADVEARDELDRLLRGLPYRERRIVGMRAQGYTNEEIGHELDLSESRVCQLGQETIARLREMHAQREAARSIRQLEIGNRQ